MSNSDTSSWSERIGATPGKLALVGGLLLVLGWVLVSQVLPLFTWSQPVRSSVQQATPPSLPVVSSRRDAVKASAPTISTPHVATERIPWPQVELQQVLQHDPFALPGWAQLRLAKGPAKEAQHSSEAEKQRGQALQKLRTAGATAVLILEGEPVAIINEQEVRIGDQLEGFIVADITIAGITLTVKEDQP